MVTLLPIEPLSQAHGMLIVAAFNELFIINGGKQDGGGGQPDGAGSGDGYGWGSGDGNGDGWGSGKPPKEWIVKP